MFVEVKSWIGAFMPRARKCDELKIRTAVRLSERDNELLYMLKY